MIGLPKELFLVASGSKLWSRLMIIVTTIVSEIFRAVDL